jgi:membrane-associated PAP2 superfamily phosphatase
VSPGANFEFLPAAIHSYFRGERQEMIAILAGSLLLVLAASGLWLAARDGFSRGFGIAAVVVALALSTTAVSLLLRDPPHEARLAAAVKGPGASAAIAAEADRMAEVVRTYPIYRGAALALGLLALLAVALSRRGWVAGAAAGVLLLVVAQWTIDHYSEERASAYARRLDEALRAAR